MNRWTGLLLEQDSARGKWNSSNGANWDSSGGNDLGVADKWGSQELSIGKNPLSGGNGDDGDEESKDELLKRQINRFLKNKISIVEEIYNFNFVETYELMHLEEFLGL